MVELSSNGKHVNQNIFIYTISKHPHHEYEISYYEYSQKMYNFKFKIILYLFKICLTWIWMVEIQISYWCRIIKIWTIFGKKWFTVFFFEKKLFDFIFFFDFSLRSRHIIISIHVYSTQCILRICLFKFLNSIEIIL